MFDMLPMQDGGAGRTRHPLVTTGAPPVAEPNGIQQETQDSNNAVLDAVSDGMSYDERASKALEALNAGFEPHEVNRAYNAPFKDGKDASGADAENDPEEAQGGEPIRKDKAERKPKKGEEQGDVDTEKLEKFLVAKRVLRRDQLEDSDIEALGMDRAIELAESRAKVHADIDRRFSQPSQDKAERQDADPQHQSDTDESTDLVDQVAEFDDELAEKVKAALAGSKSLTAQQTKDIAKQRFQLTVDRLKIQHSELDDQELLDQVLTKAEKLAKSGAYDSADQAFEDAATLILSPRREQRAQDRLLQNNHNQQAGQIDTDTIVDSDQRAMNQDERDTYAIELLGQGLTPPEVRAKLAKIPRSD